MSVVETIIQSTWTKATLDEFCSERSQSIDPSKTPEKQFELYSVPSYPNKYPEIISGKDIGSHKRLVIPNSVLLCRINPRINRAWVVGNFTNHIKIASTEWIVFQPFDEIEPNFLCYFLQQNQILDFLASKASGVGGSLMRVKPETLRRFPFAYPSRAEQHRIVSEIEKQFTRLEAGVAALQRVQANLKRYRASVLKAACEGRLVRTEAEFARQEGRSYQTGAQLLAHILDERRAAWERQSGQKKKYLEPKAPDTDQLPILPEGWVWVSLDQLLSLLRNGVAVKPDADNGLPILRISAVRPLSVNLSDVRYLNATIAQYQSYLLDQGDLLFTRYNGNPELVGVCGAVPELNSLIVHPDKLIRCKLVSGLALPSFIALMVNVGASRNYLA